MVRHKYAFPPDERTSYAQQGPLCKQKDARGKGWAHTAYTDDPTTVTCQKCLRLMNDAVQNPRERIVCESVAGSGTEVDGFAIDGGAAADGARRAARLTNQSLSRGADLGLDTLSTGAGEGNRTLVHVSGKPQKS